MKDCNYILKSSESDIANIIKKAGFLTGVDPVEGAKTLLEFCPRELYKNIDEIVNNETLSEISFSFKNGDGKIFTKTLSNICEDFYHELPPILILLGVCFEIKKEHGFLWLHNLLQ